MFAIYIKYNTDKESIFIVMNEKQLKEILKKKIECNLFDGIESASFHTDLGYCFFEKI